MLTDVRVWRANEAELHNFSRNSCICYALIFVCTTKAIVILYLVCYQQNNMTDRQFVCDSKEKTANNPYKTTVRYYCV